MRLGRNSTKIVPFCWSSFCLVFCCYIVAPLRLVVDDSKGARRQTEEKTKDTICFSASIPSGRGVFATGNIKYLYCHQPVVLLLWDCLVDP